ncbi:MAG: lytic transglycosylase domain-containing protein [Myxococcota bacterium]
MSTVLLLTAAGSALAQVDPCLEPHRDPILERAQLEHVAAAATATAALAGLGDRFHPSVWPALWARFPKAPPPLKRALLLEGVDSEIERRLSGSIGTAAIYELLGDQAFAERALAILDAHDNERASQEASWAMAHGSEEACRLAYVRGKAARKLRRYRLAKSRLAEAASTCRGTNQDFEARALLLSAFIARVLGERAGVVRAHERLRSLVDPIHSFWDDALFLEADLVESKDLDEAAALYERVVQVAGDHALEAAWRLARVARARGDDRAERRWLLWSTQQEGLPAMERDRATWWLARTTTVAAQRQDLWVSLVRRYGYHGRLALTALDAEAPQRAAELRAELSAVATETPPAPSFRPRPIFELARDYAADDGPAVGAAILHGWACAEPRTTQERLQAALLLTELGLPADAQLLVRPAQEGLLEDGLTPETVWAWRTIYSLPFQTELSAAAEAEGLDPLLLTALAREESRFDPSIQSWAGALGLTQLMPATAAGAYASVVGGRLKNAARLKEPGLNARLGAHLLATELRRYGSVPLALSAYNAGPGLTNSFLRKGPQAFPAFVESISISQTRAYVRRVTESWLRYRLLYGAPGERFPELPSSVPRPR